MKMKRWLLALVAVTLTNMAFAGNTSELRGLIDLFFGGMEQQITSIETQSQQDSEMKQQALDVLKALKGGLINYDDHLNAGNLNETDKAIDKALNTTIPAIFNKIKNSSDEINAEITPVLKELASNIIKNQTEVPASKVKVDDCTDLLSIFAFLKADQDGTLSSRAARVIQAEQMETMMEAVFSTTDVIDLDDEYTPN